MEQIRVISKDLLCIIPRFEGDEGLLNLFIKKAQYIYSSFADANNAAQQVYVFHAITSRLGGRAAALLSEREDVNTWARLKEILIQHFGDPRSEECIAIELEQMKIKSGESYIDFCHRIQHTRSTLFAKVNLISDEGVKAAKMIVYNNMALNVFLFNLTEDLIRIVRLKQCLTLEMALSIVTEEVNFMNQYNARNKTRLNSAPHILKPQPTPNLVMMPNPVPNLRFGNPAFNQKFQVPGQNFKFGIPPQQQPQGYKFGSQNQPNAGFRFNQNAGPQNFRFGMPRQQPNFNFGIPQQNQGFRPQMNTNFARPPPPPGFGQPQQNFKFGIPNQNLQGHKPTENTDVSMRTARPLRQNMLNTAADDNLFYNNELFEESPYHNDDPTAAYYEDSYAYSSEMPEPQTFETDGVTNHNLHDAENFQVEASSFHPK